MKKVTFATTILVLTVSLLSLYSCKDDYSPKPHAYPKVTYPERNYKPFDASYCAFTFIQPTYMEFAQDTLYFDKKAPNQCWFNLQIPIWNATIHFTYTPLKSKEDVFKIFEDAYMMASEHDKKADANTPYSFNNTLAQVYGTLYEIEGYVASPFQFVVTDSSKHALRGALYFNAHPNPDSLAPMIEFVQRDMMQILNTLKWVK